LIDRSRNSCVLDAQSFRGADCDADHLVVGTKLMERLAVSKKHIHFIWRDSVEGKEVHRIEISNKIAGMDNLDAEVDINRDWVTIRVNINISAKASLSYYELEKPKPWFDKGCSRLLDQRKKAKLQWLQDPSIINGDNLKNIRSETNRHVRNNKREHLKDKINELATTSKNNIRHLYRRINEFKKGYQPRSNLVKDESGDLLANSYNILNLWKNYFCQLLNANNVSDVRQTEIHTAEPLVPDHSLFVAETAIAKLKRHISPGRDQIPTELIQAEGEILLSWKTPICKKEKLFDQWKESIIAPVHRKGDVTDY
jgi:hypothetical protein